MIRTQRSLVIALCVLGLAVLGLGRTSMLGAPLLKPIRSAGGRGAAPDFGAIARLIVDESARVKEGDSVLITGDPSRIPLMEEIAIAIAKKGAFPHMVLDSPAVQKRLLAEVPGRYLATPNPMTLADIKMIDVAIGLSPVQDPAGLARFPEERVALTRKASQEITESISGRPLRTVSLGNPIMPTEAAARFYGVPLVELEARFWEAVRTPHAQIEAPGIRVKAAFESGREIRVRTKAGTDLKVTLAGARVGFSDGQIHQTPVDRPEQVWLPAGEVYTAPEVASVNGIVVLPAAEYRGIRIKDLRLTFENGRLTRIEAPQNGDALQEALARSTGDKDLFAFIDVGVNPNSRTLRDAAYFTSEMSGMVSIGIGQAPWADSPNRSDFSQEFFIPNATLEVDGKTIVREGSLAI